MVYSGYGHASLTELTQVPGTGMEVLQDSQKFGVGPRTLYSYPYPHPGIVKGHTRTPGIVPRAYRTYTSSGYGYECRTELTAIPGTGNTPGMVLCVPYRTQPWKFYRFCGRFHPDPAPAVGLTI